MTSFPVTVYEHDKYEGAFAGINYGAYFNLEDKTGLGDVNSIKVAPFTKAILYDETTYHGKKKEINGPKQIPNLDNYQSDNGDKVRSISIKKVTPANDVAMKCCTGQSPASNCPGYSPNSSQCDSVMNTYCNAHPADPYCTCIKSPVSDPKYGINPKCVDRKCLETGYVTTAMQATNCPTIINCNMQSALANSGVSLVTNVEQHCDINAGGTVTNTSSDTSSDTDSESQSVSPLFILIILFVFILIVFGAMIGIYFIVSDDLPWVA
jgi:hypothetical protein